LKISSIDPWFFGFNLAVSPKQGGHWFYLLIPLITGILQYFQAVSMTPPAAKQENEKNKKEGGDDFQKAMNTQMKFMFPIMIGWFSYTLPVGLSLYWNIFSLFSIYQGKQLKVDSDKQKNGVILSKK
jgi:YidC/Oxa1 family membrane protein insertase